jgi:putative hemolysin
MSGYWWNIVLVGVLVVLNAVFAGSEIALISLREGQLKALERRDTAASRTLVRLARDPNRFLATIQIGITLAGFLASAAAAVSLAEPVAPLFAFLGSAREAVAIALITLILTFFTLVFGELAPKRLAMQYAERWALAVARPLDFLSRLSRPAVWVLGKTTDLIVRIFGGDPRMAAEQLSPEELRDLVIGHRGLNAEQRTIITGALEIHERILREVLVPRRNVFTIRVDVPTAEAREALASSGHTRAPIVRDGHLDDVIGVVTLRDLLDDTRPLSDLARPPVVFPDSVRVSDAIRRFKDEREQFALVANEHGAIDGIVTLEDLLEEIVGEIYDETDPDVMSVQTRPDGALQLPGTFPVHDLVDLGVELEDRPEGDYATIAGLVLTELGRIPTQPGDRVALSEWTIEVTAVAHHAITEVRLHHHPNGVSPELP